MLPVRLKAMVARINPKKNANMKTTNALIIFTNIVIVSVSFIYMDSWKQSAKSEQEAISRVEASRAIWTNEISTRMEQIEKKLYESNEETKNTTESIKNLQSSLSQDSTFEYYTTYTDRDSDSIESLKLDFNALGKDGWKYMGYCMNDGTNGRVVLFARKRK